MAKPKNKPNRLGEAPTEGGLTNTVDNSIKKPGNLELVPLNFKVDAEFRRDLKSFAVSHDMSMVNVLKEAFKLYRTHKGG